MRFERSCGTLLHPTSLPSPYGIGDLGPDAIRFIDFLHETGQKIWQVLPLNPVGQGNSPYTSFSAFAGNPYMISPDRLVEAYLLTPSEADAARIPGATYVDYERVHKLKTPVLKTAADRFYRNADSNTLNALESFRNENRHWLDDFVLFMSCSEAFGNEPWNRWESGLANRKPDALQEARRTFDSDIRYHTWSQFEFFRQWSSLHAYASGRNIRIIGDIPIFVNHNSADVWANRQIFSVDNTGNRISVAGVPPDYFSETGQLWGNPLYRWNVLEKTGYAWWIERFRQVLKLFDATRIDHFRGFDSYWEVAADERTAMNGRWVRGPGSHFFKKVIAELGTLPVIAEDLGLVTPSVGELRDEFNFPGMRVLQFAFDSGWDNSFLPHNYSQNSVVYSGTHDNDTTLGWYNSAPEEKKHKFRIYANSGGHEPQWDMIRLGILSVADQAIFPMQDFMNLDSSSRMNIPGLAEGNWNWRFTYPMLEGIDKSRIMSLIELGNR